MLDEDLSTADLKGFCKRSKMRYILSFQNHDWNREQQWTIPVVPARGGAEVALKIYNYKTFLIYRTCMRRAPAKPVRACTLRNWCLVSHVTFQAPLCGRGVACTRGSVVACTRGRLVGYGRMYTRTVHNYTRIGDVHFLLVKYNENWNLWYMYCRHLQPCVGVGLSRLFVRPWSQLHANSKRL